MTVGFEIEGFKFIALNGGPIFKFNPSVSFFIRCETEAEVDELYDKLSEGGGVLMPLQKYPFSDKYAWITDKYGVSWQLILSEDKQQKIAPCLLFVGKQCGNAEEAIKLYTSMFSNSKIGDISRYGANAGPDKEGTVNYASFWLENQEFVAMDSALKHDFMFNEAISFLVDCEDQAEVDRYWERLSAVPESEQCGWLKDKYGVSWQIVPKQLPRLLSSSDKTKASRVMNAMLKMKKLDVEKLTQAAEGK
jgi:predicted 3-demethylubiquinone-9 3-methyltransferase (glyoxalase superfamily)